MEYSKIEQLADRFLKGECSEADEQALKEALLNSSVELSPTLKEVAQLLRFFDEEKENLQLSDDFDQTIMSKIRQDNHGGRTSALGWPQYGMAAAAAVLLLVLSWLIFSPQTERKELYADSTIEDPMKAYEETKKALMFVSTQMNEGMGYLEHVEEFDKAKNKIVNN